MSSFLHSKEWLGFQTSIGRKTFNLGEGVFVIKIDLPWFGKSYLYSNFVEVIDMTDEVSEIALQENAIFFKVEPMLAISSRHEAGGHREDIVSKLWQDGWRKSNKELQPQKTVIVNLTATEDELLARMHTKTRYNINIARRHGVQIQFSNKSQLSHEQTNFNIFWGLLQRTALRDKFYTHTEDYYRELLKVGGVELVVAFHNSAPLAAAFIMVYGDTSTYLHGASDYEYRALMAPHLLHWEVMRTMGDRGIKHYDFWGIDKHRWPGVTRFKSGFGGRETSYIGSYDTPLQKMWYTAYSIKQLLH